ncbi:MAG: UDP-N-acetylmuramoyl-tripeptide--D-alanyl-D-alanine ligase [Firmicutes bacterium]|nr:UDP-N-acetylmuramoyl-tripeptide--D-alanyl-D-alanine ligase [Bacillota bacterium]
MIQKTIMEIANYLGVDIYPNKNANKMINGVSIDSRLIQEGTLYVPMIGARVDGHSFINSAIEKGAGASFWQKDHLPYPEGIELLLVEDTQKALQDLSKAYIQSLDCKVIAVTGSNGKTSCKDMLHSVFSQEKKCQKTQGNRNNEIGLPLTILDFDADIEIAVLEMGMENFNEIDFLCKIAQPDVSIITTIGSAHMENLGGKVQIAQAKCEIFDNLKKGGLFLYNKDCPEIDIVLKDKDTSSHKVVSFGKEGDIQITSDIVYEENGICFSTNIQEDVHLRSFGQFQAMNCLPVIYVAKEFGLSTDSILNGLKNLQMTKMRTQLLKCKNAKILDDSYKSNPESAKGAIDTLMCISGKKHVALLSDMLDLGPEENELHKEVGAYAKEKGVDLLYCVGPLSKYTVEGYGEGAVWFENKESLINAVFPCLNEENVLLVKGSRAMTMDTIVSELMKGNE